MHECKKVPPLERLGRPEDVAGVVSFLAGPDGGWVIKPGRSRRWQLRIRRAGLARRTIKLAVHSARCCRACRRRRCALLWLEPLP